MAVIRNLVVKIGADISGLSKSLKQAQKNLEKLSKTVMKVGLTLTAKITTPLIALGTISLNVAGQLEESMEDVSKSFSDAGEDIDKLSESAKKMARTTSTSVTEVANAMNVLRKAGYSLAQMEDSLTTITNLATGSNSDLATATNSVVKVLGQFNMKVSETNRVTNVMAGVLNNSHYSLDELTVALGLVGLTASQVGFSIEETCAGLAVLSKNGYKAEDAGSALKSIFQQLSSPTSDMIKTLDSLGLSMADIDPATNSLAEIVGKFTDAGITSADAVRLFGDELEGAFMTLVSESSSNLEELTEKLTDSNSAEESAIKKLSTLSGLLSTIKIQLNDIGVQLGEIILPVFKDFLENCIIPLINIFTSLSDKTKKIIVIISGIAVALGPTILAVSKIIKIVSSVLKLLGTLATPMNAILVAIGAVIAVIVKLYKTNEDFRNKVKRVWDKVKSIIGTTMSYLTQMWDKYGEQLLNSISSVFSNILAVITEVINAIIEAVSYCWDALVDFWNNNESFRQAITTLWQAIKTIITDVIRGIVEFWKEYGDELLESVSNIFQKIWTIVSTVFAGIVESLGNFFTYIEPIWEQVKKLLMTLWDVMCELYELLKPVFDAIGGLILGLLAVSNGVIQGIINALGPLLQAVMNLMQIVVDVVGVIVAVLKGDFASAFEYIEDIGLNFKDFFINLWEGIKNFFGGFIDGFVAIFEAMGIDIVGVFKDMWNGITKFFSDLWDGIKSFATGIWDTLTGLFGRIGDWFVNLFKDAFNWGKNLVNMIADGIESAWESVKKGCNKVIGTIKGWLGFGSPTEEGPGRYSDEWAPNFMKMYSEGFESNIPQLESALNEVAETVSQYGMSTDPVVSAGETNIGADVMNGMLTAMSMMNTNESKDNQPIYLNIDGTTFARLIYPKLTKEFQRNGVNITEGGF